MAKNNELIRVAKKAADEWSNTDAYYQAAQIIDILLEELDKAALTPPNEPLTLEELSLCNDPVWIKRLAGEDLRGDGWAIVEGPRCSTWINSIPLSWEIRVWWPGSEVADYPKPENYGKIWFAYRRPPEGEEEKIFNE